MKPAVRVIDSTQYDEVPASALESSTFSDALSEFAREDDDLSVRLMAMQGYQPVSNKKPLLPNPKTPIRVASKASPCFAMFKTGKCPSGSQCAFSHAEEVLREYWRKQRADLFNSPYASQSKLQLVDTFIRDEVVDSEADA